MAAVLDLMTILVPLLVVCLLLQGCLGEGREEEAAACLLRLRPLNALAAAQVLHLFAGMCQRHCTASCCVLLYHVWTQMVTGLLLLGLVLEQRTAMG
jgi:hypothetical protein